VAKFNAFLIEET